MCEWEWECVRVRDLKYENKVKKNTEAGYATEGTRTSCEHSSRCRILRQVGEMACDGELSLRRWRHHHRCRDLSNVSVKVEEEKWLFWKGFMC